MQQQQVQTNRSHPPHSHCFLIVVLFALLRLLQDEIADKAIKLTARERRFIKFASVEFDGQIYMTPQDFLESVVEQEPRRTYSHSSLPMHTPFSFFTGSLNVLYHEKSVTPH